MTPNIFPVFSVAQSEPMSDKDPRVPQATIDKRGGKEITWISVTAVDTGYSKLFGPFAHTAYDSMLLVSKIKTYVKEYTIDEEHFVKQLRAAKSQAEEDVTIFGRKDYWTKDIIGHIYTFRKLPDLTDDSGADDALRGDTSTTLYALIRARLLPDANISANYQTFVRDMEDQVGTPMPLSLQGGIYTYSNLDNAIENAKRLLMNAMPIPPDRFSLIKGPGNPPAGPFVQGMHPYVGGVEWNGKLKTLILLTVINAGGPGRQD